MGKIPGALFFFLLMTVATVASGVLAYLLVTGYQTRDVGTGKPTQAEMVQGQVLRGFSNQLVSAANLFHQRVPREGTIPQETRDWLDRQFRADVNALRLQLAEAAGTLGEPGLALLNAADRLAALAMQPERAALRARTLREVREAARAAESVLRRSRADRWLAQPPVLPAW